MCGLHIHHLVPADAYIPGQPYLPSGYAQDGFIHCTTEPELLMLIASQLYRDQPGDFLVLVIDPARLTAPVRYEPPSPAADTGPLAGRLFPHIYGPLNPDAVIARRPVQRAADGTFLSF